MSVEFLKALLDFSFYDKHKASISDDFVPREYSDLYNTILRSHIDNKVSLSPDELKALHSSYNPVMSVSKQEALEPLYTRLKDIPEFSQPVLDSIISNKLSQRIADEIASTAIDIASGKSDSIDSLQTLLDKLRKVNIKDVSNVKDLRKIDIVTLVTTKSHSLQWHFNLHDLQDRISGIGAGYFGIVAARPDAGKTSFYMALACAPNGFIHQGAKVHIIGNEEGRDRLKLRALSALIGIPDKEIEARAAEYQAEYASVLENLFIEDGFGYTVEMLDNYCHNNDVDILIIDQLDKLGVQGKYGTSEEKLRSIYTKTREIAKRHLCGVIGICQAGFTAHNKLHYGFECLEGSKTGKGAECDWCITIGMESQAGKSDNYYRAANIPKNKVTGKKAPVFFVLNPEIARIHA